MSDAGADADGERFLQILGTREKVVMEDAHRGVRLARQKHDLMKFLAFMGEGRPWTTY